MKHLYYVAVNVPYDPHSANRWTYTRAQALKLGKELAANIGSGSEVTVFRFDVSGADLEELLIVALDGDQTGGKRSFVDWLSDCVDRGTQIWSSNEDPSDSDEVLILTNLVGKKLVLTAEAKDDVLAYRDTDYNRDYRDALVDEHGKQRQGEIVAVYRAGGRTNLVVRVTTTKRIVDPVLPSMVEVL